MTQLYVTDLKRPQKVISEMSICLRYEQENCTYLDLRNI